MTWESTRIDDLGVLNFNYMIVSYFGMIGI